MRNPQKPQNDIPDILAYIKKIDHLCAVGDIEWETRAELLNKIVPGSCPFRCEVGNESPEDTGPGIRMGKVPADIDISQYDDDMPPTPQDI